MALVKGLTSLSTWVGRLAACQGASTCSSVALNQCPHARATARLGWIAGVANPHPPAIMSACHLNRMATSQSSPPAQNQSRLKAALSLHASALWATYKTQIWTVGAVTSVWVVWRVTYLIATSFISVTTTMAEWGFMGIAVGIVAAGAQYARWYWSINPSAVYRRAMMRLNTSPAVLEVLGAPVVGSDLRAHIVTGGNLYMSRKSTFRPKISSRRLQMIFPLRGSERDGLASVEVKRKQGQYLFKLLAVDVRPLSPNTRPARVFLEGTPAIYERGSALGELRDPFLKAVHIQKNIDKEEEMEEEQEDLEEIRRRQEKGRLQRAWWQGVFKSAASKAAPAAAAVVDQAKAAAGAAAEGAKAAAGAAVDQVKAAAEAATSGTKADTTGTPAEVGTIATATATPPTHSSGSYPSSTPAATPASPSAAAAAAMPGASSTAGSAGSGSLRSLLFGPPKK